MNPLVTSSSPIFRTGPTAKRNNLHLNCDKSCEILFADSRRRRRHADELPPLPGIARCRSLKMLGIIIGDDFSVAQYGQWLVMSSTLTHYALRVLCCHRLNTAALQHVYRATIVTRLTYAASAWRGFIKAFERQRIDLVIPWILLAGCTDARWLVRQRGRWAILQGSSRVEPHTARSAATAIRRVTTIRTPDSKHLSIRLSCLIVIFRYACCTKRLTNSCFYVCSSIVVGLRYVMPINKRTFEHFEFFGRHHCTGTYCPATSTA